MPLYGNSRGEQNLRAAEKSFHLKVNISQDTLKRKSENMVSDEKVLGHNIAGQKATKSHRDSEIIHRIDE